jgi:co-chaperonin GroES (HSP10)
MLENKNGEVMKKVINLKEGYESVEPLNDYVLVHVTDKDMVGKSAGGILYVKNETDTMPCLKVLKVSKALLDKGYNNVKPGDIIEVADVPRLTHFYGTDLEKYAMIDSRYIAGVYRKKEE